MGRKTLVTDTIYWKLNQIKKQKNGGKKKLHAKEALGELKLLVKTGELPPDTQLPGESAIRRALQEISKPFYSPLENPWTVGSCLKYDIPGDFIPALSELQKLDQEPPHPLNLTIRQARWVCRLYPAVEKLIEAKHTNCSERQRLGYHFLIAEQYAECERLGELLGRDCPDTSELDTLYFINQTLDITEGFFSTFLPEMQKRAQQALENFTPLPIEILEPILGKLTKEQVNLFNEWLCIQHIIQAHPRRDTANQLEKLLEQHPELIPLTQAWMKWCIESQKEALNERSHNTTE